MLSVLLFLLVPVLAKPLSSPPEKISKNAYGPLVDINLPFAGPPVLDPEEAAFVAVKGRPNSADTVLRAASPTPTVTFKDGTVIGYTDTGVEAFRGIPFAEPPLGNLRFKPPVPLTKPFGKIPAQAVPRGCPQFIAQYSTASIPSQLIGSIANSPLFQAAMVSGEDCLTINVQRPANTTESAKLPVVAWIFGGGFELGATNQYSGFGIVNKSMSLGKPIIYVAMNYRLALTFP